MQVNKANYLFNMLEERFNTGTLVSFVKNNFALFVCNIGVMML